MIISFINVWKIKALVWGARPIPWTWTNLRKIFFQLNLLNKADKGDLATYVLNGEWDLLGRLFARVLREWHGFARFAVWFGLNPFRAISNLCLSLYPILYSKKLCKDLNSDNRFGEKGCLRHFAINNWTRPIPVLVVFCCVPSISSGPNSLNRRFGGDWITLTQ